MEMFHSFALATSLLPPFRQSGIPEKQIRAFERIKLPKIRIAEIKALF